MNKKKMAQFRNLLAETGLEMTLEEAGRAYEMAKDITRRSRKMSVEDIWRIMDTDVEGVSEEEKEKIVELYMTAKEI